MKALKKHRDKFHKEDKYPISLFGVSYGSGKSFLKRNFNCMQCGMIIVNEEDFKDHLEGHTSGQKQFKCDICEKKFEFQSKLKIHVSKHSDEPDNCPYCGGKLLSQKAMKKHISRHQKSLKGKKEINLQCKYCGFLADTPGYLATHMFKEHDHNAIFCDICGQKSNGTGKINEHMDIYHPNGKQYKCNFCEKEYQVRKSLLRHVNFIHKQKTPYNCQDCGKGFVNNMTLDWHMNVHSGLKPYKCEFCGQGFQNPSNLGAHQKKSCKQRP